MKHISFLYGIAVFCTTGCQHASTLPSARLLPRPTPVRTLPALTIPPPPYGFRRIGRFTTLHYNDRCAQPGFSPNNQWLAAPGSSTTRGAIFLWNVRTQKLKRCLQLPSAEPNPKPSPAFNHILWSPDGKQVIGWGDQGPYGTLGIWDCSSGKLQFSMNGKTQLINSACYQADGTLLIAWSNVDTTTSIPQQGHIAREWRGKIQQDVSFKDEVVTQLVARKKKSPLAVVSQRMNGRGSVSEPLYQWSVREWKQGRLSKPLIRFDEETYLSSMVLSHDEKRLALGGMRHLAALHIGFDLTANKIIWRTHLKRVSPPSQLSISSDDRWLWSSIQSREGYITFNVQNGALAPAAPPPTYQSHDGKLAVRLLNLDYLSTYDLNQVRVNDPKFGPAPNLPIAYLYKRQAVH